MRARHRASWAILLAASVAAPGCGADRTTGSVAGCGDGAPIDGRIVRVVTTVAPITNIVSVIAAGTAVEVTGIVPEGVNSHTYEPTPSAAAAVERADVVILNGLGLEAPTFELAIANRSSGGIICELGDEVLPPDEFIFDFSFPEAAGLPNPHLWTNPPMVKDYAAVIRDLLDAVSPADAERIAVNFENFTAQIDELDAATRTATASVPADRRTLLTYHDAYAYFAREYGWTVLGAVQPSSFSEPTPRDVAALVEQIAASDVAAIFGSEVFPSPVLRQLAEETGVEYVDDLRDDDLPGEPGDPDHSWLELMRFNLVTIVAALGGDTTALDALDTSAIDPDDANYP